MRQASRWCRYCKQRRLAVQKTAPHILHLVLTVLTCGLWSVLWFLDWLWHGLVLSYRCQSCGGRC